MGTCDRWGRLRIVLMAVLLAFATSSLEPAIAPSDGAVVLADKGDKKDNKNKGEDGDADHVTRGMVIGIDTLKDPPELTLASRDGDMRVIVLKTDEIALNGVKIGDYLKLDGEKIHEQLFEAQMIEVEERCPC